jgi:hypothetical protein
MGNAIDTVSGYAIAPSSTFTAWTMNTGDSLTVRNANPAKRTLLLDFWGFNNAAGTLRIRSPKLHDNVQGIRAGVEAAYVGHDLPFMVAQVLYPQDTLIAEQTGSGTAGQYEEGTLMIYYEDLPGVAGRFIDPATLLKGMVNVVNVEVALTPGAVGNYTGQLALNSQFDLLQANTDYAVLGAIVSARATTVCLRGPDTGNLRVPVPCEPVERYWTNQFLLKMSDELGIPLIPVINSANKAGTFIDVFQNQTATAVTVQWVMAQLAPGTYQPPKM